MKVLKLKETRSVVEMGRQLEMLKKGGNLEDRDLTKGDWHVVIGEKTYKVTVEEEVLFIAVDNDLYDKEVIKAIMGVALVKEGILVVGSRKTIVPIEVVPSFFTRHKKKILIGMPIAAGVAASAAYCYLANRTGLADAVEDLKATTVDLVDTAAE